MKSVVIESPGYVKIIEVADPIISSDDILLEIQYIGLCESDVNSYRGLLPLVTYPIVPGHEVSGKIMLCLRSKKTISVLSRVMEMECISS